MSDNHEWLVSREPSVVFLDVMVVDRETIDEHSPS